ncbi:SRPBCC domain-containing protein [Streptomyces sp. LP05-1]|uniref:SRPBCC domain-containing protein n=1 Tax=Streptomyces pyxinae TaxID=2970734 RepID=A0ABT2CMP0_9ACTN|nr:SRPBCC domain-containing protein [Streptomyces sp. LP05-1]MCS0638693.1 SRPBCC domain-containing protein [Streptomyces sp. LP05-1]
MEHEVFVPVGEKTLREALADPVRVARCVPGLQRDADASAGPLSGRLKVRAGGHTITYRGALRVVPGAEEGAFEVTGEGGEVRGGGSVKLALTVRTAEADGGTTLSFSGTLTADGRLAELPADAAESAGHRLLDRFAETLAETAGRAGTDTGVTGAGADPDAGEAAGSGRPSVFDTPVPPSALDPLAGPERGDDEDGSGGLGSVEPVPDDLTAGELTEEALADGPFAKGDFSGDDTAREGLAGDDFPGAPAEAAHARRTMIGRSAEEVDHAPPRGRYAPAPGPDTATATATLRWLAPAAALALASAVVLGRALRRRR